MAATEERPSHDEKSRTNDADTTHAKNQHANDTPNIPLRTQIEEEIEQLQTIGDERDKHRAVCAIFSQIKALEREENADDEWQERHSFDPTQNLGTMFGDEHDERKSTTSDDSRFTSQTSTSWADAVRKPRLTHAQPAQHGKRHIHSTPQIEQPMPQRTCDDDDDDHESEQSKRTTHDY